MATTTTLSHADKVEGLVATMLARHPEYTESEVRTMAESVVSGYEAQLNAPITEIVRTVVCTLPDCRRRQETSLDMDGTRFDGGVDGAALQGRFLCEECGEESVIPVRLRKGEVIADDES